MKSHEIKNNTLIIMISIGILMATINTGYAQTVKQERESRQKIKSFITEKYPDASSVCILDECWGYRTTFKKADGKYVSAFSLKDQWLQTEKKISMAELPDMVKQGFQNSRYKAAKLVMTKKVLLPNEPSVLYMLEVSYPEANDNSTTELPTFKDMKLYYTASGALNKQEEQAGETLQSIPWGGQ